MWRRLLPDPFTVALLLAVLLASVLPAQGLAAHVAGVATQWAIALLFFLHGAKLSRQAVVAGFSHWRLHLVVVLSTFAVFPLLGWLLRPLLAPLVTEPLYAGVLFLCAAPSTVQSSIAFTSMARGNVSAAVCAASASSLIGIVATPLLAGLMLGAAGSAVSLDSVLHIVWLLLVPFAAGQLAQYWIGAWVQHHHALVHAVDQGSILLVVYTAFSASVLQGLWRQLPWPVLAGLLLVCLVLLALILGITWSGARRLGFAKADEITIVFCGSKKSLASGVPMAQVLFAGPALGMMVLPLMLFHQVQLMVCAVIARRYARRTDVAPVATDERGRPPP